MARRRTTDPTRPTALYRFYDDKGQLLYVGITVNPPARWRYHERERAESWWPHVARKTLQWFDTRREAALAEIKAIKIEGPLHNVLHTPTHATYGNRPGSASRVTPSRTRGTQILSAIKETFPNVAFTQMDILPIVPHGRSAVGQNFRTLQARGEIVAVGRRSEGGRGLGHILYALSTSSLAGLPEPIYEVSERAEPRQAAQTAARATTRQTSKRRPCGWAYGDPPGAAAFRTLTKATEAFGDRPFTRVALVDLTGLSLPSLLKHVISLEKHGYIQCVGRGQPNGRPGHPPKLYTVLKTANEGAKLPRQPKYLSPPVAGDLGPEMLTFREIAERLVSGEWGRPMKWQRVAELAERDPEWPIQKGEWELRGTDYVFPWGDVAAYLLSRAGRLGIFSGVLSGEPRGYRFYLAARQHFAGEPFTAKELSQVAGVDVHTIYQNVRCLAAVGLIVPAGQQEGPGMRSRLMRAVAMDDGSC